MKDTYSISAQELESINTELFNSFDPEQELWIIGGSSTRTTTTAICYSQGSSDVIVDYDITFW